MIVTPKLFSVLIFLVCFTDTEGWLISYKPKDIQVDFWLYTKTGNSKEAITTSNVGSKFVNGAKTICLIHGYVDKGSGPLMQNMKDELLKLPESVNVIIVNWQNGASEVYNQCAQNTRTVGDKTGDIIKAIKESKEVPYSKFHIIGHSLGAHCGGFAGQRVIELTGKKIGRISGLDPAGYTFASKGASERLSIEDADFVDVMHTDVGTLLSLSFGYVKGKTVGHVDFYPNGGHSQPECSEGMDVACSHKRSVGYFTSSINTCQYHSYSCLTGAVLPNVKMGYHSSPSLRGTYCITTAGTSPYCTMIHNFTFGEEKDSVVKMDSKTGKSRGFVTCYDPAVIQMHVVLKNTYIIDGRMVQNTVGVGAKGRRLKLNHS